MRTEGSTLRQGWSNRPVVLETDEREVRTHLRTLAVFALALVPAVFYVVATNHTRQVSYETTAAQLATERLIKEERELATERARLESLREVETWAVDAYGLSAPPAEAVVVCRTGRFDPAAPCVLRDRAR